MCGLFDWGGHGLCTSVVVCVVLVFLWFGGGVVLFVVFFFPKPSTKDNIWQHESCIRDFVSLPSLGFMVYGAEEFEVNTKACEVIQKYSYHFCYKHVSSSAIQSIERASVLFLSSPFKNKP